MSTATERHFTASKQTLTGVCDGLGAQGSGGENSGPPPFRAAVRRRAHGERAVQLDLFLCEDWLFLARTVKMPSVGKNELLAWLGAESGQPCRSLEDLKNGTIILATLERIFPRLAERRYRVKRHPRFDWEHGLNWESIAQMCQTLKLPTELIDRSGLQVAARHRSRNHNLEGMHDTALCRAAGMPLQADLPPPRHALLLSAREHRPRLCGRLRPPD